MSPTKKPRVHWILPEDVMADLELLAKAHTRSLRLEATVALQDYIARMRREEPELFTAACSE